MITCFEARGDNLCCGSCGLPAGFRVFFFRGGLSVWLLDVPDGAVQPAAPRHVVALVSRAPEIEPYVAVSSWVRAAACRSAVPPAWPVAGHRPLRADRVADRAPRRRRACWLGGSPLPRPGPACLGACADRRRRKLGRDRRGDDTSCSARPRHPGDRRGERRLSYRRNAAEISELVGRKLRAWT
ncbi:MAG: hypothetical protein KatS3mg038_2747 [Candidatus Kapaibacterium sp.]|nr:MAG: hypothetical protein KatS3mg038_2747 [Candidatus Kapabacteria bacterium]